jgi:hypothetical protein
MGALFWTYGEAQANGRFPRAERLLEDPDDAQHLILAATYGLLQTNDGGESWYQICESSFGIFAASADPLLELSSAGVLGGLAQGVTLSEDGGCDFQTVLGGGKQATPDISVDKSDRSRVLGLVKVTGDDSAISSELHESLDGGRMFTKVGPSLTASFDFPFTVDSAPSEPQRVYVSGVSGSNVGQILRSDDGGLSWEAPLLLAGTSFVNAPFIAAVAPERADLLFVRTDGRELVDQQTWAKDSLFIGDLSGEEGCHNVPGFCEVFAVRAKLFGFALSPQGDHVLLGLGDPQDSAFRVDARFVGLYSGSLADLLAAEPGSAFPPPGFSRVHSAPVSCVTWTANGIYVCTSQAQKGFALGFAPDLPSLLSDDLTPLLDLAQVRGPLSCPDQSTTWQCRGDWDTTCQVLGACDNQAGAAGAAPSETAGQGGTSDGAGGSVTEPSGGKAGSSGGAPSSGSAGADKPAQKSRGDSGCALGSAPPARGAAWITLGLVLLLARRRAVD